MSRYVQPMSQILAQMQEAKKVTKKEIDKLEDDNEHGMVALKLAQSFGTPKEVKTVQDINKRHERAGSIEHKDQKERDAIIRKYYKMVEGLEINEKAGDTQDLKKLVGELQNASKMHLAQSKRVKAHVDMMKAGDLKGTLELVKIVRELEKASEAHLRQSKAIADHTKEMGESNINEQMEAEDSLKNWKHDDAKSFAEELIEKYGKPDEVTQTMIKYNKLGAFGNKEMETYVIDESIPHSFPDPHRDFVYTVMEIKVPSDMLDTLGHVTGSIVYDGLKETVTARCGSLEANALTLQFVKDLVDGKIENDNDVAKKTYADRIRKGPLPKSFTPEQNHKLDESQKDIDFVKAALTKANIKHIVKQHPMKRSKTIVNVSRRDYKAAEKALGKEFASQGDNIMLGVLPSKYMNESESVELDEKYDLYHSTFSGAMQHAYDYAKKKMGITVDPKEIDNKVATGPRKPTEGKTNTYRLKGKGGNLQIQVYNKGGSKPFELNMYKEEIEMNEKKKLKSGAKFDFQLFDDMKGAKEAEAELNKELHKAVRMKDKETAKKHMMKIQMKHSKFGATDTEPREVINMVLNAIFENKQITEAKQRLEEAKVSKELAAKVLSMNKNQKFVKIAGDYVPEIYLSAADRDKLKDEFGRLPRGFPSQSQGMPVVDMINYALGKDGVIDTDGGETSSPKLISWDKGGKTIGKPKTVGDAAKMAGVRMEGVELNEVMSGKDVAKRMMKIQTMKPFASKVAKMKTVSRDDLEKMLPDYIDGADITKVLKEKVDLGEGYEGEVMKILDDAGIDGYFKMGKLYVSKRDAKDAKKALEDADNITKLPTMVKEEKMTKSLKDTIVDMWQESAKDKDEGNAFGAALQAAKEKGEDTFMVAGKKYDVKTEKLVGGQKKLDKDKDGDIDAKDFAMLRKQKKEEVEFKRYLETKRGSLRDSVLQMWGENVKKESKKDLTKNEKDDTKKMTDTGKDVTPVDMSPKMPKIKNEKNRV